MAIKNRTTLKTYFENGDFPDESNFIDLIDSMASLSGNNEFSDINRFYDHVAIGPQASASNEGHTLHVMGSGGVAFNNNAGGLAMYMASLTGYEAQTRYQEIDPISGYSTKWSMGMQANADFSIGGWHSPALSNGNSYVYLDFDNNYVGIMESVPTTPLDVYGIASADNAVSGRHLVNYRTMQTFVTDATPPLSDVLAIGSNANNENIVGINILSATEIHSISSFTHYQDILISELSGFNVTGSIAVTGDVIIDGIVTANNLNIDNWDSTYTTVNVNSASWDSDFCDDTVLLGTVSTCSATDTIEMYANLDLNGHCLTTPCIISDENPVMFSNYTSSNYINPLDGVIDDASAITYSGTTDTLWIVQTDPGSAKTDFHEFTTDGTKLRTVVGSNFIDIEGICWISGNYFAVAEERTAAGDTDEIETEFDLVRFTITAGQTTVDKNSYNVSAIQMPYYRNHGPEGITYDHARDIFYINRQGIEDTNPGGCWVPGPSAIGVFSIDLNSVNTPISAVELFPAINMLSSVVSAFPSVSANFALTDIFYHQEAENLFITTDEPDGLIQTDLAGNIIEWSPLTAYGMPQTEGVTFNTDHSNMYLVSEPNYMLTMVKDYSMLTISEGIAASRLVTAPLISASCGTSDDWCSTYTTVNTTSADWDSTYTTVNTTSATWDSTYTTVNTNSATWDSHADLSEVAAASGGWNSTETTVIANSGNWDSAFTTLQATSGIVGAINGIVKADGGGNISAAVADTDYQDVLSEGAFADGDKTKLGGIEALADVTDETNVVASLDGATLSTATVATGDKVVIQDLDNADNIKTVTAQSIANLAPLGATSQVDGTYGIEATAEGATTGNARGENSVDLCTKRSNAAYVPSGINSGSIAGENNGGSGTYSFYGAGKNNHTNTGNYCNISGEGNHNNASSYSIIGGKDNDYISTDAGYSLICGELNSKTGANVSEGSHSIIGGKNNYNNSGDYCLISGYANRSNSGGRCQISGYENHHNTGNYTSISGSYNYSNSGKYCSISGYYNHSNSGDNCIIGGGGESGGNYNNSGDNCLISGNGNHNNSGNYSQISGYSNGINTGDYCQISGRQASSNALDCARVHGGGANARIIDLVVATTTTTATPKVLTFSGATEAADTSIVVPSDTTWGFTISVVGRRTDADDESAFYKFEGCIDNNAGTTALVGSVVKTIFAEDTAAWDVNVTAHDTLNSIRITVTGEGSKTIKWTARVDITQADG